MVLLSLFWCGRVCVRSSSLLNSCTCLNTAIGCLHNLVNKLIQVFLCFLVIGMFVIFQVDWLLYCEIVLRVRINIYYYISLVCRNCSLSTLYIVKQIFSFCVGHIRVIWFITFVQTAFPYTCSGLSGVSEVGGQWRIQWASCLEQWDFIKASNLQAGAVVLPESDFCINARLVRDRVGVELLTHGLCCSHQP